MQPQAKPYLSPEAYLRLERRAETRSEYLDGEIYALAGASRTHNLIATNLIISLGTQVRGRPCEVYSSDMRIKVCATGLYTYPDVAVVCGSPRFEDRQKDTLLNPGVIIEVLSPSTETYDRGAKFDHYSSLESLSDYLLVAQDGPKIGHFVRQPEGKWLFCQYRSLNDVIPINSIDCVLSLADVYDKVEWPEEGPDKAPLRRVKEQGADYLST